jgi:ABC-type multidrug transport system fused ATPase/permease subunit
MDPRAWRGQVAWLPQRPTLFAGSVRDNVALGAPAATDGAIRDAVAAAAAAELVEDLPHGYDTRLGEGDRALSSGERRRIALARALLRDGPLLLLDEPTANLDEDTAARVIDGIRRRAEGRAVLLIEHRADLSGIADRVVHLDDGRAVEPDLIEARA